MEKAKRQSGIELLRILLMMGVVLLHYNDGKAFVYAQGSSNLYVLFFLESLCICAVDLFILISGYFLSGTQKRNYLKPLELLVQTMVLREVYYLITVLTGQATFSLSAAVFNMIPSNYFVILYAALYLISPYLNRVFAGFTKQQWNRFMLVCILLFSLWPTLVDVAEEFLGAEITGISTISFKGSLQGFNIVNFVLLYFVGAYLRFQDLPKLLKNRWVQVAAVAVLTLMIFAWTMVTRNLQRFELRSAWVYHNTLVILMSAVLFVLFRSFTFQSSLVNELSGGAFTCFLIHGYLLPYVGIEKFSTGNALLMLGHIVLVTAGCYLVSYVVHKVYHLATDWAFRLLAKLRIFRTTEDV